MRIVNGRIQFIGKSDVGVARLLECLNRNDTVLRKALGAIAIPARLLPIFPGMGHARIRLTFGGFRGMYPTCELFPLALIQWNRLNSCDHGAFRHSVAFFQIYAEEAPRHRGCDEKPVMRSGFSFLVNGHSKWAALHTGHFHADGRRPEERN